MAEAIGAARALLVLCSEVRTTSALVVDDREEDEVLDSRHLMVPERLNTLLRNIPAVIGLDVAELVVGGLARAPTVVRDDGVPSWTHCGRDLRDVPAAGEYLPAIMAGAGLWGAVDGDE
jgi:hypothetical protein